MNCSCYELWDTGRAAIAVRRIYVYLAGRNVNWITSFTRTETNEPRCCKQTVPAVQQYGVCTKVRSCTLPGGWDSCESYGSSAGDVDQCTLWVRTADSCGLSCQVSSQPWGTTRAHTADVKKPGRDACHPSSSSAEVKNAFSCVYFHHLCRAEASDFTEVWMKKLDGQSGVWGKMDGSHTCLGNSSYPSQSQLVHLPLLGPRSFHHAGACSVTIFLCSSPFPALLNVCH